jgi:hypothetical protein
MISTRCVLEALVGGGGSSGSDPDGHPSVAAGGKNGEDQELGRRLLEPSSVHGTTWKLAARGMTLEIFRPG